MDPPEVKTDFELALVQSIHISFPNASFRGCYYHFSQAIWRKVQSIGLQQEHQTQGSEVKKFFRRVITLPFVPVRYVRMAWSGLKAEKPSVTRIEEFIDYFECTWLN